MKITTRIRRAYDAALADFAMPYLAGYAAATGLSPHAGRGSLFFAPGLAAGSGKSTINGMIFDWHCFFLEDARVTDRYKRFQGKEHVQNIYRHDPAGR